MAEPDNYGVCLVWFGDDGKMVTSSPLTAMNGRMSKEEAERCVSQTIRTAVLSITRHGEHGVSVDGIARFKQDEENG